MPAWDLIDAEPYRRAWVSAHGYFSLNLVSSRGCPYRCNWCAKPIWSDHYRCRAAHLVAAEMLEVKTRFRPDQLWFADDIFALSPHWTHEFAAAVGAATRMIPFKMQSRCDLMTRRRWRLSRRAGCAEVWMGAESGSQNVLDAMDKGMRVGQVYEARENLRRHGIRACYFLQFGYPGETWAEIEQTIAPGARHAPGRYRRFGFVSAAGHGIPPDGLQPAWAQGELVRQRRSRDDVPGRVHHRVLPRAGGRSPHRSARWEKRRGPAPGTTWRRSRKPAARKVPLWTCC